MKMAVLDVQDAENDLPPGMKSKLTAVHNEYDPILLHREISWRQKTRFTWINEGDVNLSFFFFFFFSHRIATGRKNKSVSKELEVEDGSLVRDERTIAGEFTNFYQSLYMENLPCHLFIEGLDWHPLDGMKAD